MMKIIVATTLLILLAANQSQSVTDYCDASICDEDETHIGCDNDGSFDSNCPEDASLLDVNEDIENLLVTAHLKVRQQWASGQGNIDVKACRMATLSWDSELASLAELNVKQCKMEHDECHNTDKYRSSGQNLYISGFKGGSPSFAQIAQDAVDSWASEGSHVTAEYLASYPENYAGPTIGHFTIVANDRNIAIGCAASNYVNKDGFDTYLVACNYATTNFEGEPVYKACDEAASDCTTGTNPDYPALCSADEDIGQDENDY